MISAVIPIHNEVDNVNHLHGELIDVFNSLNEEYEIIFVDDGSRDNVRPVLEALAMRDSNTRFIQFARNYGQTAALVAGIKSSVGDVIVTLDGDLQNAAQFMQNLHWIVMRYNHVILYNTNLSS